MRFKTAGRNFGQAPATRFAQHKPKVTVDHYKTPEHKAWAAAVIKRAGFRCEAAGCSRSAPEHRMFADHIVEIKDGGDRLALSNGQCLCGQHHSEKTARAKRERLGASYD